VRKGCGKVFNLASEGHNRPNGGFCVSGDGT